MQICKKCGKIIPPDDENNRHLCFHCYQNFLFEKVEKMHQQEPTSEKSENFSLKKFLKKLLNR